MSQTYCLLQYVCCMSCHWCVVLHDESAVCQHIKIAQCGKSGHGFDCCGGGDDSFGWIQTQTIRPDGEWVVVYFKAGVNPPTPLSRIDQICARPVIKIFQIYDQWQRMAIRPNFFSRNSIFLLICQLNMGRATRLPRMCNGQTATDRPIT